VNVPTPEGVTPLMISLDNDHNDVAHCCWIAARIRMSRIGGDARRSGSSSIERKP
jgi:hypothetical protein